MKCPIFNVADIIGKKWSIVVIQEVFLHGDKGFNFILNRTGISPKMLSQRLKDLESEDIAERKVDATKIPIKTSYSLTQKGKELYSIIESMKKWNSKHSKTPDCSGKECVKCSLY